MSTTKPKNEESAAAEPKAGALTVADEKLLAEMRSAGGADQASAPTLPMLKLEHTTDVDGEPNPHKGKFTLATRDALGNWNKKELGEEVECQILMQRYVLKLVESDTTYSSREFDNVNDVVQLFKSTGQGDDRKTELFAEGTAAELGKKFMVKDEKDRVRSKLKLLYVLYLKLGDEIVKWKTNVSGTVGYRKYQKSVHPFAVVTKITREEAKSGTNKYYQPKFQAVSKLENFQAALDEISSLRAAVELGEQAANDAGGGDAVAALKAAGIEVEEE